MKPVQMDRMDFSDHFSYINLFILSYRLFSMIFEVCDHFWNFQYKNNSSNALLRQPDVSVTSAGQRGRPGQS